MKRNFVCMTVLLLMLSPCMSQSTEQFNNSELELQLHEAIIISLCLVAVILLLIIIGLLLYFHKNTSEEFRQAINEFLDSSGCVGHSPILYGKEKDIQDEDETDIDRALFLRLDRMVTEEQLFTDPNLNREKLCELIGVNKNRIGSILKQYSGEANLSAYINHKRMIYAVCQMREHPNWTILAIAQSSGITNTTTFNRLFRKTFGMYPTEYQEILTI